MIILMQCLNEEYAVNRCIGDFHHHDWVSRIIVIDGGSTDYTREELKNWSKVEVYIHPWLDWYHDMNVSQRNIGLSYIPHGETCFILDFDEKISDPLIEELGVINSDPGIMEGLDLVFVPRRTFDLMRYPNSPYAIVGPDGWPVKSNQIGQYPDLQPRIIKRNPALHWMNSPHHSLGGVKHSEALTDGKDIIHYEKEDARDRLRIERKWAREQATRKRLGLTPDVFETRLKPEVAKYGDPEGWKSYDD